jgi:hypothetical protein
LVIASSAVPLLCVKLPRKAGAGLATQAPLRLLAAAQARIVHNSQQHGGFVLMLRETGALKDVRAALSLWLGT